jgi:uncharacterized protein (TIGR03083 family)
MDLTRSEFQDLVGAYALDACEPEETSAIDAYVAAHADAAAEAERLRDAAAWLGVVGALQPPPPPPLRERLLSTAAERVGALAPADALIRETARFEAVLDSLRPPDLELVTFNGLTVRELVAHVAIIDEAFVAEAGEHGAFVGAARVLDTTNAELPAVAGWSFGQIRDRFRASRGALIDLDTVMRAGSRVGGYSLASALVIRAFETWTHLDDILRALGREPSAIEAPVMRTMAELAVHTLPMALAATGYEFPGRTARIVMTGPGGGDWTIAATPGEAPAPVPHLVMQVPVVEFCRRFAERLTVDEVPCEIEGDAELARALVDAAPAFAGL